LSNTRTEPVFCTTYQRAEFPGSWSMAMGCVKFGRFENARCTASDTAVLGGSPADRWCWTAGVEATHGGVRSWWRSRLPMAPTRWEG
jgi:hypothetical protein